MLHLFLTVVLLAWLVPVYCEQYSDNALVTCTACHGVKVKNWNCDVNCKVTKTGMGRLYEKTVAIFC